MIPTLILIGCILSPLLAIIGVAILTEKRESEGENK